MVMFYFRVNEKEFNIINGDYKSSNCRNRNEYIKEKILTPNVISIDDDFIFDKIKEINSKGEYINSLTKNINIRKTIDDGHIINMENLVEGVYSDILKIKKSIEESIKKV